MGFRNDQTTWVLPVLDDSVFLSPALAFPVLLLCLLHDFWTDLKNIGGRSLSTPAKGFIWQPVGATAAELGFSGK